MVAAQNYNQQPVQEEHFMNQFDQDGQALELSPIELLDLLNDRRVNEILDNLNNIKDHFSEQYLPWQLFEMSVTMEKLQNIRNLSNEEYDKLVLLYEASVIHDEFGCFYELESENNDHIVANVIHTFDQNFWNGQGDLRENYLGMVYTFRDAYGENRVDTVMEY